MIIPVVTDPENTISLIISTTLSTHVYVGTRQGIPERVTSDASSFCPFKDRFFYIPIKFYFYPFILHERFSAIYFMIKKSIIQVKPIKNLIVKGELYI